MKCPQCGNELIISRKWRINKKTYVCDKCDKYWFNEDSNRKIIIKNGMKFYNINSTPK